MHLQQRLRKKKEGAAEIKLPIQLSTGFYGNKSRFVWLEKVPAPPAHGGESLANDFSCSAWKFESMDVMLEFCVAMESPSWETQWTIVFLNELESNDSEYVFFLSWKSSFTFLL